MKQEGKQRKWPEPVSVRAGCGGSARRRFFVSVKEVVKEALCVRVCVKGFCGRLFFFFAVWRFFLTWRGLIGVA